VHGAESSALQDIVQIKLGLLKMVLEKDGGDQVDQSCEKLSII